MNNMSMFTIAGLEWMGCPQVIVILAESREAAIEKLLSKDASIRDLVHELEITEIEDGYVEIGIG